MKYVVLKDFLDRFDNMRHCKPGEEHVPPSAERAKQLIAQGFIAVVDEEKPETTTPNADVPKESRNRGKKDEVKPKDDDDDSKATDK